MSKQESKHVIAILKTVGKTNHPEDIAKMGDARRIYTKEELLKVLPQIKNKPIGLDHKENAIIPNASIESVGWNDKLQGILAELSLPEEYIQLIQEGKVMYCSWDIEPNNYERTSEGIIYKDFDFKRLDLLTEGRLGGDPLASVTLLESEGKPTFEIKLQEPMGQFSDWDECIAWASNQPSIDNPEAYCGYIKSQTEAGKTKEEIMESLKAMTFKKESMEQVVMRLTESTEEQAKELIEKAKKVDELEKKSAELQEALNKAGQNIEAMKKETDGKIIQARKEATNEIVTQLESKLPSEWLKNRWGGGASRFVEAVKKVVRDKKEE